MGPEEIRETLAAEGLSEPAIDHGLASLATASGIRAPLNFVRHVATNDYKPGTTKTMGCVACRDGWLLNPDTGDQFFPDPPNQDRVRPCRTCRSHHYERGAT